MLKTVKYLTLGLLKNWIIILFTLLMMLSTVGFFQLEGQADKAMLGLLNLSLLLIPILTLIFSTIYYYNMYEFLLLVLSQPLKRNQILLSLYLSLLFVFCLSISIGIGLPLLFFNVGFSAFIFYISSLLMSAIFIAIALFTAVVTKDKSKGMGLSLIIWVYFVLIFDGIILLGMYNFSDYPIEKFVLYLTFLNPVDLSRVMVLMQTQTAALMGYSGAVFNEFFTTSQGLTYAMGILLLWALLPLGFAFKKFKKKDL